VMNDTEFFWIWSEFLLVAYPKEKIKILDEEKSFFQLSKQYLGQEKLLLWKNLKTHFLFALIGLILTFYVRTSLNYLDQKEKLIACMILFGVLLIFKLLLTQEYLLEQKELNKKLELTHASNYLEHIFKLPLLYYKLRSSSDYLIRFWEAMELKLIYSDVMQKIILGSVTIVICFYFIYFLFPTFFPFLGITAGIYYIFHVLIVKISYQQEQKFLKAKVKFQQELLENIEGYEVYYYLNQRKIQKQKVEEEFISFLEIKDEKTVFYQRVSFIQHVLKECIHFSVLTLGIIAIYKKEIPIVNFLFLQEMTSYLIQSLESLASQIPKEKYLLSLLRKNAEFLTIPVEKDDTKKEIFKINGDIYFKQISYSYNQYNYVLKNLNLHIIFGSHVQLFGQSGCGKSTICKLILRLLEPLEGKILIGPINILDINLPSIRSSILYLNQRSHLLTGTIWENIIMGRNIDMKRFYQVCEICHLEEIVAKKPLRYETTIQCHEENLSGGEKQRIMLARTLYGNAFIYLFDESLSEVDEKLEKDIIKRMREFLKAKTIIYISHKNYKSLFDEVVKLEACYDRVLIS